VAPSDIARTAMPALSFATGRAGPARRAQFDAIVPKLDAFLAAKMKEVSATGFAVGVIVDGEPVYLRGFGVRDLVSRTPIDADSVFRLASLTKSFTALAILRLRDEGKLALDTAATHYLPELARANPTTRDAAPITLRMLLTNGSGLAYDDLWGAVTFGKTVAELDEFLKGGVRLTSSPGSTFAYSNLGWALLGRVVEHVSKMPFSTYVTENILRPLGMTSTVWDARAVPTGRLATGYRTREQRDAATGSAPPPIAEALTDEKAFAPAGGLYASLRDYGRYIAYQMSAYPPRDDAESGPVRRSTLREMHEGQREARFNDRDAPVARVTDDGLSLSAVNYGLGWWNVTSCREKQVLHGGFEPGYFGWTVLMPESRVAYFALATTGPASSAARTGVLDILRDGGLLAARAPTADPALVAAAAGMASLVQEWSPAVFARIYDPQSAAYSWNVGLREQFVKLRRDHGLCSLETKMQVFGPLHGEIRLACERGAINFDLLLSPATPPRLQDSGIREEWPVDAATARTAQRIAAAIGDVPVLGDDLPAASFDKGLAQRTLRRLAIAHGTCTLAKGDGRIEVRRGIFETDRSVHFGLACSKGSAEMTFTTEPETGRVTSLQVHTPRAFDLACWP
jgi:CubicO group peptidase (beta-lactamase class C family)